MVPYPHVAEKIESGDSEASIAHITEKFLRETLAFSKWGGNFASKFNL